MSNQPLTNSEVVSALGGKLLDQAAERMDELVTRLGDEGQTAYVCQCGESFSYMTLLELHRIEKHDDCDSIDQAVAFLGMTAAEQRGRADLRLIVDGIDPQAFEAIEATERRHGFGRTAKTVVLHRGVSIVYVLDDERDPVEALLQKSTDAVAGRSKYPTQRAEATTTPEGAKGWVDQAGSAQVLAGGHGLDVAPDASPDGVRAEARHESRTAGASRATPPTPRQHSVRVEPSLTEALAIANQHDIQVRSKW